MRYDHSELSTELINDEVGAYTKHCRERLISLAEQRSREAVEKLLKAMMMSKKKDEETKVGSEKLLWPRPIISAQPLGEDGVPDGDPKNYLIIPSILPGMEGCLSGITLIGSSTGIGMALEGIPSPGQEASYELHLGPETYSGQMLVLAHHPVSEEQEKALRQAIEVSLKSF